MPKKHDRRRRPRTSVKEQQPEKKKRPREGEGEESQPKPRLVDDWDFYESGEDEVDQDFKTLKTDAECGFWRENDFSLSNLTEIRECDKVRRCDKFLHKSEFYGYPVVEIYKVKLIVNKALLQSKSLSLFGESGSLSGRLYGVIETISTKGIPDVPDITSYFSVKRENAVPINLTLDNSSIELPLSLPRAIPLYNRLMIRFAFKFEFENGDTIDLFDLYGNDFQMFDDEVFGEGGSAKWSGSHFGPLGKLHDRYYICHIERHFLSYQSPTIIEKAKASGDVGGDYWKYEILGVAAYFGIYNGIWFNVDVQILKVGVTKLYGFIYARPCIFLSRICLLSVQSNQMCKLPSSGYLELARPVVAIPSFSSLVIEALLYDQDGNVIVHEKTFFKPSSPEGSDSDTIGEGSVRIHVKWECNH